MENKHGILFALLFLASLGLYAFRDGPNTLILSHVRPVGDYGGGTRSLDPTLYVEQDGHSLSFGNSYEGYMVILYDEENNVVFTDHVGNDGIVSIPETIHGAFTLIVCSMNCVFEGEILIE